MSTWYLVFVGVYAMTLAVACMFVFTSRGHGLIIRAMQRAGRWAGAGPWGFLHPFGHTTAVADIPVADKVTLAEDYLVAAESETLRVAHTVVWVMIAGCVACAAAGMVIAGILPPLVISGAWTYERYLAASILVIDGTAGGGLAVGAVLVWWILRRTMALNRTDGCAAARDLAAAAVEGGVQPHLAGVLDDGSFPRLSWLVGHGDV